VASDIFLFDDELMDFKGTAALCECMDLVLSVDTSLLHLSGALGKRTGCCCHTSPTGDGCEIGKTRRGIHR
jgi:hypothetical protein